MHGGSVVGEIVQYAGLRHLAMQLKHVFLPRTDPPTDPDTVRATEGVGIFFQQLGDLVTMEILVGTKIIRHLETGYVRELNRDIPRRHGGENIWMSQDKRESSEAGFAESQKPTLGNLTTQRKAIAEGNQIFNDKALQPAMTIPLMIPIPWRDMKGRSYKSKVIAIMEVLSP
jgi:hypothetical protein